ncbi:exosortase F system-associated protein [Mangrovimonas sp. YM274]|uniref:exosortase F system-associated membrane protein n=1 Tax=Mangrovimonas sp. YM274 TaxID=3070660 RepID=UPI0027DE341B|nr:exosortase F system-associated protein [Mangrovimonas sp. YM274]WMI68313.1 exosortase F system-associated protein [Mangrovimonas sp. YM274]
MKTITKYILMAVLIGLLVLIRFFENDLFYDPYLEFFKNDYLYMDNPRQEVFKLTLSTTLRYVLNTLISLGILFVAFKDWSVVKFSTLLYGVAYVVLIALFLYFVLSPKQSQYYLFFNIRRFLIQPIGLLLLLPAFYYQRLKR